MLKYERETFIRWNDEDDWAYIETANKVLQGKLQKLVKGYPKEYVFVKEIPVDEKDSEMLFKVKKQRIHFGHGKGEKE